MAGQARCGHCIALPGCDSLAHSDYVVWLVSHAKPEDPQSEGWSGTLTLGHVNALSSAVAVTEPVLQTVDPQHSRGLSADQRYHPNGYGVSTNSARGWELAGTNQ